MVKQKCGLFLNQNLISRPECVLTMLLLDIATTAGGATLRMEILNWKNERCAHPLINKRKI
jgi:hypothetical protein